MSRLYRTLNEARLAARNRTYMDGSPHAVVPRMNGDDCVYEVVQAAVVVAVKPGDTVEAQLRASTYLDFVVRRERRFG